MAGGMAGLPHVARMRRRVNDLLRPSVVISICCSVCACRTAAARPDIQSALCRRHRGTAMATIYYLKNLDGPARDERAAAATKACEIILFPGVRYERWVDAPQPQAEKLPAARKSRTKKRELEMAD